MSLRIHARSTLPTVILGVIVLHIATSVAGALPEARGAVHEIDTLDEFAGGVSVLRGAADDGVYIVFVHGIHGTPRDFRYLIDSLDRRRFHIAVFHYASSKPLDEVAKELAVALAELSTHERVRSVAIVAHSMGGLIARHLLVNGLAPQGVAMPLLVTLSTPWEGHAGAAVGARLVPGEPTWRDVAVGSDYINALFQAAGRPRHLPEGTRHHLLFSYRKRWLAPGPSGDRVVSVASQLGDAAQEEAVRIYGFDVTHVGILKDAGVASLLTRLLDETFATPAWLARRGAPH